MLHRKGGHATQGRGARYTGKGCMLHRNVTSATPKRAPKQCTYLNTDGGPATSSRPTRHVITPGPPRHRARPATSRPRHDLCCAPATQSPDNPSGYLNVVGECNTHGWLPPRSRQTTPAGVSADLPASPSA
eukprot:3072311-Pyramimonas_sp.AAC.2